MVQTTLLTKEPSVLEGLREVTDEEIARFHEQGWVKLDGLVSPKLAAEMLDAANQVLAAHGGDAPAKFDAYGLYPDDDEAGGEARTEVTFKSKKVVDIGVWQSYHWLARDDAVEPFYSIAFGRTMGRNAQRLLNRPVGVRYYTDQLTRKMPKGGIGSAATPWHSDQAPTDRGGHMTFWIALDEVTPDMGSMRFLTGSHREGMCGQPTADADLLAQRPELFERYEMSPPLHYLPGDATVHHQYTLHGGFENTSERPRISWLVNYLPADARYIGRFPLPLFDDLNLQFRDPIDHPRFPIVGQ